MAEETHLVVARARIARDVEVEPEAPPTLTAPPGTLLVKFPYRYEEVSRGQDDFRITLETSLDGRLQEPTVLEHVDRRGLADDRRGFLVQKHALDAPGEYTLEFRAEVTFTDDGEETVEALSGLVTVQVKAS